MPIYEYECDDCGHKFAALQKMFDDPLTCCPNCRQQGLKKLISASAFRLSGSGWYESDYKKEKQRNLVSSDKGSSSSGSDAKTPSDPKIDGTSLASKAAVTKSGDA